MALAPPTADDDNLPSGPPEPCAPPTAAEIPLVPPPEPTAAPLLAPPAAEAITRTWQEYFFSPRLRRQFSGFAISLSIHLVVVIVLSCWWISVRLPPRVFTLAAWQRAEVDDEPLTIAPLPTPTELLPGEALPNAPEAIEVAPPEIPFIDAPLTGKADLTGTPEPQPSDGPLSTPLFRLQQPGGGGGLEGRSDQLRATLAGKRGGTPASEEAVALGLAWLAAHQHKNGSWHFDHRGDACDGQCDNPGTAGTTTGATALALLPFLGAGHTHQHGEYKEVVKQGLYYLQARMRRTPHGADLMEGTMYAQGLAAVALCEAYALTKDPELRSAAQEAIDFICYAQHPAGGWRYFPGQPGDTTVFGWQFMALKSAYLAKLEVPSPVIERANRYLDSVQTGGGANYGYLRPALDPTPSAVGLLSRMYLGWPHDKKELGKGVAYLAKLGPSPEDMYFNYYATQVLHHYEGPAWDKWNGTLRDHLIKTQAKQGHARGSWYFPDKHGLSGGRLYTTAMCVMILEVYYRHLPLYQEQTVDEGF